MLTCSSHLISTGWSLLSSWRSCLVVIHLVWLTCTGTLYTQYDVLWHVEMDDSTRWNLLRQLISTADSG